MKPPAIIRENVSLAGMTTFGIGGPARWLAEPSTREELEEVLVFAKDVGCRVKILGGGSNLLVADSGVDALVVRLSHAGEFGAMNASPERPLEWSVGAAVPLQALVSATARSGVAGIEALAGIPGSVGGAAAMNAGSASGGIGRFVVGAEVFDMAGGFRSLTPPELGFRYRGSALGGYAALSFLFRFGGRDEPEKVLSVMHEHRERKKAGQPLGIPSAGCVFKNPPSDSAGSLLDRSGCKGMTEGGAEVSGIHANFIVNRGEATSRDIVKLALRMRDAVLGNTGIRLEPEIVLWGREPAFEELGGVSDDGC